MRELLILAKLLISTFFRLLTFTSRKSGKRKTVSDFLKQLNSFSSPSSCESYLIHGKKEFQKVKKLQFQMKRVLCLLHFGKNSIYNSKYIIYRSKMWTQETQSAQTLTNQSERNIYALFGALRHTHVWCMGVHWCAQVHQLP